MTFSTGLGHTQVWLQSHVTRLSLDSSDTIGGYEVWIRGGIRSHLITRGHIHFMFEIGRTKYANTRINNYYYDSNEKVQFFRA